MAEIDISKLTVQSTRPAGVSEETFQLALSKWAKIVGVDNISTDEASGLKNYYDPWSITSPQSFLPSAAVRPTTVEHIQAILAVANEHLIPIWTISRGKNLGYGGSAPVVEGSVVLDLHLMRKIIEVNEKYAYAIVEPGVTFMDLYDYIQAHKLKLWISCPALGWGSIIGNCLDRGFGYTPNGEHSQQQCGMEVVLPDGKILKTGMGALKSDKTFALYKGGFGPSVDGLFYQSNLGIVTKMGMWLYTPPQAYITCSVSVPKETDLIPLVDTLSELQRRNIIQNSPSISNPFRQTMVAIAQPEVAQLVVPHLGTMGAIAESDLQNIVDSQGWGYWKALFAVYGPEGIVTASWDFIKAAFAHIPGVKFEGELIKGVNGQGIVAADLPEEEIPHNGVPHLKNLALMDYRGKGGGHTCFSPILPAGGRELYDWYITAKKRTIDAEFDFFADFHVFPRYTIGIELWVFSADEAERADRLYRVLADDANEQGYSEYRTHVAYMDLIADHFSNNDSALRKFVTSIKDGLDPNNILSPGKQGIWGTRALALRSART